MRQVLSLILGLPLWGWGLLLGDGSKPPQSLTPSLPFGSVIKINAREIRHLQNLGLQQQTQEQNLGI